METNDESKQPVPGDLPAETALDCVRLDARRTAMRMCGLARMPIFMRHYENSSLDNLSPVWKGAVHLRTV
jgi:hypothetical protein